jgi:tetratricopeptide (TPR) repeat protein
VRRRAEAKRSPEGRLPRFLPALAVGLGLAAAVAAAYAGAPGNGFVDMDDPLYVRDNPEVRAGLTAEGVRWAFTTFETSNWHPLTWLSLQLDATLFGPGPWGFHLTNVVLHAANTLLLYLALLRMTGAFWRSAAVAALFGLHPLHVESVAWVAERKDVLSGLFWMLALLAYARYAARPGLARYLPVLLAFMLGLLAKPMVVTLPCVLLLLDYWPLGRLRVPGQAAAWAPPPPAPAPAPPARLLLEKVPLLALAAVSSAVTVHAQQAALHTLEQLPFSARVLNALVAYVVYLGKAVWPADLAALYQLPAGGAPAGEAAAASAVLLAVTTLALGLGRRRPYMPVGWLWYLGTLVPVIGLVQVGIQAYADRYTYLPSVGLFLAAVWGLADLAGPSRAARAVLAVTAAAALAACAAATWAQVATWRSSQTVWEQAVRVDPDNALAWGRYAAWLAEDDRLDDAAHAAREALRRNPGYAAAENVLGSALLWRGRPEEAVGHFEAALRLDPNLASAHAELGAALRALGRWAEALAHLREAVRRGGDVALFHTALALALQEDGRAAEADAEYRRALALDRRVRLRLAGRAEALATHPDAARRSGPLAVYLAKQACVGPGSKDPGLLSVLAEAYAESGRFGEAAAEVRKALAALPPGAPPEVAAYFRGHLALYEKGLPVRGEPPPAP